MHPSTRDYGKYKFYQFFRKKKHIDMIRIDTFLHPFYSEFDADSESAVFQVYFNILGDIGRESLDKIPKIPFFGQEFR